MEGDISNSVNEYLVIFQMQFIKKSVQSTKYILKLHNSTAVHYSTFIECATVEMYLCNFIDKISSCTFLRDNLYIYYQV